MSEQLPSKEKVAMVRFGPCVVPSYPVSAFSRFPAAINLQDVWRLCGPTVERNINMPLWAQFCAVYLEGMNHAAGVLEPHNA